MSTISNEATEGTKAEELACVLDLILNELGLDDFLCFIDDDDEHMEWLEEFRSSWRQVHFQCYELCELMPGNADKYRWQLGEFEREAEAALARKLKKFPWTLLARTAGEALANGYVPERVLRSVPSVAKSE